jgi:hypothetical protein
MEIEFYDVKRRQKVGVPVAQVKKTSYTRETKSGKTQTRYAVIATYEGSKLMKFMSKDAWEKLNAPIA